MPRIEASSEARRTEVKSLYEWPLRDRLLLGGAIGAAAGIVGCTSTILLADLDAGLTVWKGVVPLRSALWFFGVWLPLSGLWGSVLLPLHRTRRGAWLAGVLTIALPAVGVSWQNLAGLTWLEGIVLAIVAVGAGAAGGESARLWQDSEVTQAVPPAT